MNNPLSWAFMPLIAASLAASNVVALTVRIDESPNDLPALINHANGSLLEITLQLWNDETYATEKIATWQLVLDLAPEPEAEGELHFESFTTPAPSLYGEWSSPLAFDELPTSRLTVTDFDTSDEGGASIGAHDSSAIISFNISVPGGTNGSFGLYLRIDEEAVDNSSFWAGQDAVPLAFRNEAAEPQLLKLATINVSDSTELPGDFNGDLVVDAADYTVWRDGLHGMFELEHYGIWKQHFGESRLGPRLTELIPEPSSPLLVALGVGPIGRLRRRV